MQVPRLVTHFHILSPFSCQSNKSSGVRFKEHNTSGFTSDSTWSCFHKEIPRTVTPRKAHAQKVDLLRAFHWFPSLLFPLKHPQIVWRSIQAASSCVQWGCVRAHGQGIHVSIICSSERVHRRFSKGKRNPSGPSMTSLPAVSSIGPCSLLLGSSTPSPYKTTSAAQV